ncbi:MAG: hypothetical protein ACRYF5_00340 [Janthinobacterium lividum]
MLADSCFIAWCDRLLQRRFAGSGGAFGKCHATDRDQHTGYNETPMTTFAAVTFAHNYLDD